MHTFTAPNISAETNQAGVERSLGLTVAMTEEAPLRCEVKDTNRSLGGPEADLDHESRYPMSTTTCSPDILSALTDDEQSAERTANEDAPPQPGAPESSEQQPADTAPFDAATDSEELGDPQESGSGVSLTDFRAYMPMHSYIFVPTREMWPAASVNARLPRMPLVDEFGRQVRDEKGKPVTTTPGHWLDQHRPVEQVTWAPGEPELIENRIVAEGGWLPGPGCAVFNLYRPPVVIAGDPALVDPWLDHLRRLYGRDAEHLVRWFAQRVQRPGEKVNHALLLGGGQGIGKDTILEPVRHAIGPWNAAEIAPQSLLSRFNPFLKSVLLRVSEARDLGEIDRYGFYEATKTLIASPPDVLLIDEKNVRQYYVPNVVGVVITTNHLDGLYLPPDDRRHFVAWSECTRADFSEEYWQNLWGWLDSGGIGHVAAYLRSLDIGDFNPKAPPPKTDAFFRMVEVGVTPEDEDLRDALEELGHPQALTLPDLQGVAGPEFATWLAERRNRRMIPARLQEAGYVSVRRSTSSDGRWKVAGKNQTIYARSDLTGPEQVHAAEQLIERLRPGP